MAARKNRKHTRATIEKIRQSIDTGLAIQTLTAIMNDAALPPTVRVKASAVLLDKTMPSLTSADIHDSRQEQTKTYEEIRLELISEHGEPLALLLLKEITQGQYLTMMQAELGKQTASNKQIGIEQNEHGETGKDVILAHPHAVETIQ